MPDVNETLVRDYFESLDFLVTTNLHYETVKNDTKGHSDVDLVVSNPERLKKRPPRNLPFVLTSSEEVGSLGAAVVEVKGWHAEALVPSYLKPDNDVTKFINGRSRNKVKKFLGTDQFVWVLAISRFGPQKRARIKTKQMLKDQGVNHVITFKTILRGLIDITRPERHYGHSEYLHLIRLLKVYGARGLG